jgi:hypothetical protein
MLSACDYRDRAAAALANAGLATEAVTKAGFECCAEDWRRLAEMAEEQDLLTLHSSEARQLRGSLFR